MPPPPDRPDSMPPAPPIRPTDSTPSISIMPFMMATACSFCCSSVISGSKFRSALIWRLLTSGMKEMPIFGTCIAENTSSPSAASSTNGLKRSAPRSSAA